MVAFTYLALALSAISSSLAVPTTHAQAHAKAHLAREAPDFELNANKLDRRQDYDQNYKTSGNIQYSSNPNGYSVSFSNAGDFVVGKGWKTGTDRTIIFNGTTTGSAGTVLVAAYGWTIHPEVEYYVQEYTNGGSGAAQGQRVGSVTCDGSAYDIYKHEQINQPSITGTGNFWQYISSRQNKRMNSGAITMKCHFDAWAAAGLQLGSHQYQTLSTESWGNAAGSSHYTVSGN